jgi:hypothetical protein
LSAGSDLLAYTYIDLLVALAAHDKMARDAKQIYEDLQKIDPEWYLHLDDTEAKAALKAAFKTIQGPRQTFNLSVPGEVVL